MIKLVYEKDYKECEMLIGKNENWNFLFACVFVDNDLFINPLIYFM